MACDLTVDLNANEARYGDKVVKLPPRLAEIATVLASRYPDIIDATDLGIAVFGIHSEYEGAEHNVRRRVIELRKKLFEIGVTVRNVFGKGYGLSFSGERPPVRVPWTQRDIDNLKHYGTKPFSEIAHLFPGRSEFSVRGKWRDLGYPRKSRDKQRSRLPEIARLHGHTKREIAQRLGVTLNAVVGTIRDHREAINALIAAQRAASHRQAIGHSSAIEPRPVEPGMRSRADAHAERGTARAG